MKKIAKILCLCLISVLLLGALSSCAGRGEVLMEIGDHTVTLNEYELMLSRMKGALYSYGYDVAGDSFWKTVVSVDGMTYDDYFSITVMEEASKYLVADHLFAENGLSLDGERIAEVDGLMAALVKHAGSKTALNEALKEFGVNYDILRDVYLRESRIDLLKEYLYGEKGEKLEKAEKEAYLKERYVAFGQIFLASYYYVTDTDNFGDTVYYTDEKHTAIAYDQSAGKTVIDEFGKTVTDIFGNPEYYNEDGRIAYDTANGVIGYVTDQDGNPLTKKYDEAALGKMFTKAGEYARQCNGDMDAFRTLAAEVDESEGKGEVMYLVSEPEYYGSQSNSVAYLDEIAAGLGEMQVGECRAAQSEYGFHVFMKFEIEEGAYDNEAYEDTYTDFNDTLIEALFGKECGKYYEQITVNEDAAEKAPAMAEVGINILY